MARRSEAKRPLSKLEIMQREMESAIAGELYERAAELRDAINLLEDTKAGAIKPRITRIAGF